MKLDFFQWIRCALWYEPLDNDEVTWDDFIKMYTFAKTQSLHNLIACVGCRRLVNPPRKIKLNSIYVFDYNKECNQHLNNEIKRLVAAFDKHHIDYIIVKGQVSAMMYPEPMFRTPGDIDVYIAPKDQPRIADVFLEEFHEEMPPFNLGRHTEIERGDISIEIHCRLNDFNVPCHQRRWNKIVAEEMQNKMYVNIDGCEVTTFSPEANMLYTFVHFYFHLITLGVGLRQLIDLMMWINEYNYAADFEKLRDYLIRLELYDAFCVAGAIMVKYLGLPKEKFPFEINHRHAQFVRPILDDIFRGGNFGQFNRKGEKKGIFHTIETMTIMWKHAKLLYKLTPSEAIFLIPRKMIWNLHLNFNRLIGAKTR